MNDASIRRGYADTRHGQLHYAEAGRGAPLLLLHAAGRSHRAFRHMLPRLAEHFRPIAVDLPGFGNSARLPSGARVETMAEMLVDCMDALGLERPHVFGLHTGNKVAAALAAGWPDRVGRIVLAGQTHSIIVEKDARDAAIRPYCDRYFPRYAESEDGAHHLRAWASAHATLEGFWWPQDMLNSRRIEARELQQAEVRVIDFLHGWRSIVPLYEAIFAFDLSAAVRRIRAPTLVLELLTPQEAHFGVQGERLCALMHDARAETIDDADGLVLELRPEDVLSPILRFLRG